MLVSSPMPHATAWGSKWSKEEIEGLIMLGGEAKVLMQFAWSGCFKMHNYEGLSGCMQEHEHNWSTCQCLIKVKAMWA